MHIEIPTPAAFRPLLAPARYKGAYGGRGGAKSHFFGGLMVRDCFLNPGLRAVCVREYQTSLEQSVKRLIEDKIEQLGVSGSFRVLDTHIETPGDGIIIFQGMQAHTSDSIKSLEGYDRAWIEEAQRLSERSLTLLRPTIMRKDGAEIWASWNPASEDDPVDVMLRKNPPPDAVVVRTSFRDNPWISDVMLRDIAWDLARDPEKFEHVWDGGYEKRSKASVFKNWRVEAFDTPADATFYLGGDWGFSIDPTVLVRCWVSGRNLMIDQAVYQVGCEIDATPALFDLVEGSREWPIVADSARPETISYLKNHGFPRIEAAVKGANSVKEGIIFLQSYDIIIHPRVMRNPDADPDAVKNEFLHYKYKVDKKTEVITPVLEDKKNHVIDSVRYAVERLRHGFDYQEAGMTSVATW